LEVPSHILYVRRNGRAIWCGNSWVPQEWIDMIMHVVGMAKQWNFIFLTKNPERLLTIEWPLNAWVGATADTQERAERALEVFKEMNEAEMRSNGGWREKGPIKTFLSCEPLLEGIDFEAVPALKRYALSDLIDWIIIGGQSRTSAVPAFQPAWEWVEEILIDAHQEGLPVYFKSNLTVRPMEYPR
jgi:protein gp37